MPTVATCDKVKVDQLIPGKQVQTLTKIFSDLNDRQ